MKTNNKFILLLAVILISIGAYFAYQHFTSQEGSDITTTEAANLEQVDIGYSRLRISLPVFVAQEQGIFEKHGIKANLLMYDTAQPLMQALLNGNVDVAGYTALPITYNGMIRSGKKLYFISTMIEDQNHRISYLLRPKTPEGENPEIASIEDLKGKTIGILPTIAYKAWIEQILKNKGIDPEKDVVIQQIAPTQQAQALKSGGVDALFTNDPAATSAIKVGVAELVSNEVESPKYIRDPFPFGSFNIDKTWADKHPELFKKLTLAIDESIEYINANPEQAKQAMIPYLPENFKEHVSSYPNALYWTSEESTDSLYNEISEVYYEIGIIPEKLSVDGLVK